VETPVQNALRGSIYRENLPDVTPWESDKKHLVVIDDMMNEADDRVTAFFSKGSHHRNLSVIYIVQNLFGKNK
jgi:hypothetical protein